MAFTRVAETGYSGNDGMHIYVEYQVLSQNIAGNYSVVRLQSVMLDAGWGGGSYNNSNPGAYLYVNGGVVNSASGNFDTGNTYNVLNTYDLTIGHDANGDCSFTLRGLHYTGISLGNGDVSGTVNLPKINRAATLNSISFTNDESNPVFNVTNNSSNWMNFWIEFGPIGGGGTYIERLDVQNISSTYTMTLTAPERALLWQKATGQTIRVRMGIRTNIGGVLSDPVYSDLDVPIINANPTFGGANITLLDANPTTMALTNVDTKIIPGYSQMKVTIPVSAKAAGLKYATIVKYRVSIVGAGGYVDLPEIPANILSTTFLPNALYTISVQAIDSRGNSTTINKTAATILAYTAPYFSKFLLIRSGGGTGTTITSDIAGTFWHYTFGTIMNVVTFTWKYRLSGTTTWTTGVPTITPAYNVNAFTSASSFGTFSASYSYEVQLTVVDKLSTAVITGTIVIAMPAIKFLGNSAIVPDSTFKLESSTGVRKPILDYACPVGSIMFYPKITPPAGWLKCNGALLTRATYLDLFNVIGTISNTGGETALQFRLPDLRGEFLRGWDDARGKDAGRVIGTSQADDFKSHIHVQNLGVVWSTVANTVGSGVIGNANTSNTQGTGGTETRPTNGAYLVCIKYL